MQQSAQSNQLSLAAINLPDATAAAKLAGTISKPAMVLEPGKKITLQFTLTAKPPNNTNFETDIKDRMEKYFTAAGISVAGGQPLAVVISTANKATGKSMQFRTLGGTGVGTAPTVIQEKLIVCRIAVQRGSKVLWNHESTFNNVKFGLTRIKPGETIEQHLLEQQWSAVQTFFSNFEPPVYVFPPDARNGIGQSDMTAGEN
jgi:hypothetical protein